MQIWHFNFATEDRMPLMPGGAAAVREALGRLSRIRHENLLLFSLVDDHVHFCQRASRQAAGRFVTRVKLLWGNLLHQSVGPAYYRQVDTRSHLQSLVSYMFRQPAIHGLKMHPALWEGSCFSDLVGARWLPGLSLGISDCLPRLGREQLLAAATVNGPFGPASIEEIAEMGIKPLVSAAESALAVVDAARRDERAQLLRRAVVQLSDAAHLRRNDTARGLRCSERTLRRYQGPVPTQALTAIRMRLALMAAVDCAQARRAPASTHPIQQR